MFLNYSTSSGVKNADAQILSLPGNIMGIDIIPPDSGQAIVQVYDSENSSTSGKLLLAECHVDAGMPTLNHEWLRPIIANRGVYCVLTQTGGANAGYIIRYGLGV